MLSSCDTGKGNVKHLTVSDESTLCGELVWNIFEDLSWNCKECTEQLNILVEQLKSVDFIKERR